MTSHKRSVAAEQKGDNNQQFIAGVHAKDDVFYAEGNIYLSGKDAESATRTVIYGVWAGILCVCFVVMSVPSIAYAGTAHFTPAITSVSVLVVLLLMGMIVLHSVIMRQTVPKK